MDIECYLNRSMNLRVLHRASTSTTLKGRIREEVDIHLYGLFKKCGKPVLEILWLPIGYLVLLVLFKLNNIGFIYTFS